MPRQTIVVDAVTKEPRINDKGRHHKMQQYWAVKPQGKDAWINVYNLTARPSKGQELVLDVGCDQWTPKGSQEVKLSWWADYVPNKPVPAGIPEQMVAVGPQKPQSEWPRLPTIDQAMKMTPSQLAMPNSHLIPWAEYERTLRAAHAIAMELEYSATEDRSQARAAIINTVMIAFTNGKIAAPLPEPIAGQTPMDECVIHGTNLTKRIDGSMGCQLCEINIEQCIHGNVGGQCPICADDLPF